jgi:hypothetical protein
MSLVEAHTGVERRHPRHEVVDADDLLLVARADGGAARVAAHAEWFGPRAVLGILGGSVASRRAPMSWQGVGCLRITYGRSIGEREPNVHSLPRAFFALFREREREPKVHSL